MAIDDGGRDSELVLIVAMCLHPVLSDHQTIYLTTTHDDDEHPATDDARAHTASGTWT